MCPLEQTTTSFKQHACSHTDLATGYAAEQRAAQPGMAKRSLQRCLHNGRHAHTIAAYNRAGQHTPQHLLTSGLPHVNIVTMVYLSQARHG